MGAGDRGPRRRGTPMALSVDGRGCNGLCGPNRAPLRAPPNRTEGGAYRPNLPSGELG